MAAAQSFKSPTPISTNAPAASRSKGAGAGTSGDTSGVGISSPGVAAGAGATPARGTNFPLGSRAGIFPEEPLGRPLPRLAVSATCCSTAPADARSIRAKSSGGTTPPPAPLPSIAGLATVDGGGEAGDSGVSRGVCASANAKEGEFSWGIPTRCCHARAAREAGLHRHCIGILKQCGAQPLPLVER